MRRFAHAILLIVGISTTAYSGDGAPENYRIPEGWTDLAVQAEKPNIQILSPQDDLRVLSWGDLAQRGFFDLRELPLLQSDREKGVLRRRMYAEWEKKSKVILSGGEADRVRVETLKAMVFNLPDLHPFFAVDEDYFEAHVMRGAPRLASQLRLHLDNFDRAEFPDRSKGRFWIRDYSPASVELQYSDGSTSQELVVPLSSYSERDPELYEEKVHQFYDIRSWLDLYCSDANCPPIRQAHFFLWGGHLIHDGAGACLVTTEYFEDVRRASVRFQRTILPRQLLIGMRQHLGCEKLLVLEPLSPLKHIDMDAKLINSAGQTTLLLGRVSRYSKYFPDWFENLQLVVSLKEAGILDWEIDTLPQVEIADEIMGWHQPRRYFTAYTNAYIVNDHVLVPVYKKEWSVPYYGKEPNWDHYLPFPKKSFHQRRRVRRKHKVERPENLRWETINKQGLDVYRRHGLTPIPVDFSELMGPDKGAIRCMTTEFFEH